MQKDNLRRLRMAIAGRCQHSIFFCFALTEALHVSARSHCLALVSFHPSKAF
jgi:hypothetical protein